MTRNTCPTCALKGRRGISRKETDDGSSPFLGALVDPKPNEAADACGNGALGDCGGQWGGRGGRVHAWGRETFSSTLGAWHKGWDRPIYV